MATPAVSSSSQASDTLFRAGRSSSLAQRCLTRGSPGSADCCSCWKACTAPAWVCDGCVRADHDDGLIVQVDVLSASPSAA